MNVRFIVYNTAERIAIEQVFDHVQEIPRVGEHIGLDALDENGGALGYDTFFGVVKRVVHWPQQEEKIQEVAADVIVQMEPGCTHVLRTEAPTLWPLYNDVYYFTQKMELKEWNWKGCDLKP